VANKIHIYIYVYSCTYNVDRMRFIGMANWKSQYLFRITHQAKAKHFQLIFFRRCESHTLCRQSAQLIVTHIYVCVCVCVCVGPTRREISRYITLYWRDLTVAITLVDRIRYGRIIHVVVGVFFSIDIRVRTASFRVQRVIIDNGHIYHRHTFPTNARGMYTHTTRLGRFNRFVYNSSN